ncbi:hypothetical protein PsYK624_049640 [Phanerochaete sordida]|uniref:Uncharacterized protein n=1 Tax=Phanerochaete sordida TaxID=48140 RepID=A0A9P3G6B7_9APHY|nr:hypothetical protein PsYK624_049640 [Phanerochaete sordida]
MLGKCRMRALSFTLRIPAPSKWMFSSIVGLTTYAHDRAVLISDAVRLPVSPIPHMTPHQASGAAQGIRDARILVARSASLHASRATLLRLLHA